MTTEWDKMKLAQTIPYQRIQVNCSKSIARKQNARKQLLEKLLLELPIARKTGCSKLECYNS